MLYLEDFLELIEHLPQELRDRFTEVRENDLQVSNSSFQIDAKVKQFFAQADKLSAEQRDREYENILNDYQKALEHADYKIQLVDQNYDLMTKLNQKLDDEIEKFKLELEADRAGISLGNNIGFNLVFNWYCTCRQVSYGAMVACDNEECEIEWFHYDCVGITQPPKGEWYCSECTKKMSSINHPTTNGHHQAQTHKKRSRKEMIAN